MPNSKPTPKDWLAAFRLRTLPLSFSVIALGTFCAAFYGAISTPVAVLSFSTTLFLQILSNLANDYGDSEKGTDNHERIGPQRSVQSGAISLQQMKRAVIIFSILSLLSGLALIYFAFEGKELIYALIFFGLGIFAIGSAIAYTVGKSAYGYRGLGDLFVLIFFGLIGVMGSFFLQRQALPMVMFFPAIGMGLLSTGVLNLNNMRDMEADERAGKRTLAVLMGRANARVYHLFLLGTALACFAIFTIMETVGILPWLWLIATPLILLNGVKATTIKEPSKLDPLLKQLALSTTLLVICFGIGILA